MITLVLIAVCSSLALLYQRSRRCLRHRKFCQENNCFSAPTFPQWERILGIDLMLDNFKSWKAGQLLDRTRSRFRQVGNTYSATVAGMPSIFTIEPENIKAIFSEKFDDFDSGWLRRRAFAPSIGDVLITADGARWHQQRAMLRPAFNKQQYSDFAFYEQDIADLIKRIPGDGTTIDLAPLFHTHALTVASRLLFDEPMASLNPDFATSSSRFLDAFLQVNQGNQKRIRMGAFLPLVPRDRTYEAGCKVVHEYGDIFVQKALTYRDSWTLNDTGSDKKVPDRYIFLQEIAKDIEDRSELRNHLLGMLLVGSETTASFLTGCISLISSRPGTWTKLREEAMGLGVPSSEGLKSFTSLSYILNEVLRLYPILPLFGRMANKDTYLPTGGGPHGISRAFVPEGTLAMINTHSLHRSADIFGGDADEFKPERWASLKTLNYWNYLPFGGGPRVCIGQQFALMEVSYTLIRLLQTFPVIESRESRPWLESIGISLSNGNGAKVGFRTP